MKNKLLCIGLMSGTSLDGCDAALVEINELETLGTKKYLLKDFITNPYTNEFKEKLKRNLNDDTAKLKEICSLNFELGYIFKDTIDILLKKNNLNYNDIEFVASHGQTIWHAPVDDGNNVASTLQIGESQVISVLTGIKVISNFRVADVICHGQGAPLVPMFEYIYFKNSEKDILLQNIGGIGNVTYLKKNCSIDDCLAFDTGPGNAMIDYFVNKYFNLPYDDSGIIASSGMIINEILNYLKKDQFVLKQPPKSTGREQYSKEFFEELTQKFDFDQYDKKDIITTITEFTVYSIVYNYKNFIKKDFNKESDLVIVSGGGAHNNYIMTRLQEELECSVKTLDEEGLSSDAKEALAFACLGYLSINGQAGNVKKATGALNDCVLGQITLAKKL